MLKQQGYERLFDRELEDRYLFEVINYNLPLGDETLAERLTNIELVTGDGKVMQTGPEIRHVGISPCFNDLFIGSKGMFGIPLSMAVRVRRQLQPIEKISVELAEVDPNYKIETLRTMSAQLDRETAIKYSVRHTNNRTILDISNYGKECLHKLITPHEQARRVVVSSALPWEWQANGMFNINGPDIYNIMLMDSSLEWHYSNGLLRVRGG